MTWANSDLSQEIDKRVGYEKRYDRTHEDFRTKVCPCLLLPAALRLAIALDHAARPQEKRKRSQGQQNRDGNWVEEEKRRLRHGMTGNYDS